jgi:myo-inositol-1(or 4)-monophosphatase
VPTERVTNMFDPEELQANAVEAVNVAGDLLRQSWNGPRQISHKGHHDWVTQADIASQRAITNLIRKRFPAHGFLTEEDDDSLPTEGPVLWIVDPVDGTSNYSRKIPNFSISVAAASAARAGMAEEANRGAQYRPGVGVICDPLRN